MKEIKYFCHKCNRGFPMFPIVEKKYRYCTYCSNRDQKIFLESVNKYNNYLIRFMIKKDQIIKKNNIFPGIQYLLYSDIKSIKKIDAWLSKDIWEKIKKAILDNYHGLAGALNPFCIYADKYKMGCDNCKYRETNEIRYFKTCCILRDMTKGPEMGKLLPISFYRKIIKEIELRG